MAGALLQLLSWTSLVFTLGMFGTGLTDLRKMFAARNVENIQFLPFLTTDVNNLGWLSYGSLKGDWTLIVVNAVGATLQTLYILVYFVFSSEKLGLFCSLFTITMYLSPLADLIKIVKSRSTRCLSFPLTVTTFLASASWTFYGLLLDDLYIAVSIWPGWGLNWAERN
ncbi:hypothetical protein Chor_005088 [Crotalus horridus]